MPAVQEERATIGGVELAEKAMMASTDKGPRPALPRAQSVVVIDDSPPSSNEFSCVDCCFRCDGDYPWYSLNGKGFCLVLLLLLGYLIGGAVILAFFIIFCVLECLCGGKD
ncbi:hypothetical protein ACROYT_G010005 [Oculina patagonica]